MIVRIEIKMVEALGETLTCMRAHTRSGEGTPAWLHASAPGFMSEANGVKCVSDSLLFDSDTIRRSAGAGSLHSFGCVPSTHLCTYSLFPASIGSRSAKGSKQGISGGSSVQLIRHTLATLLARGFCRSRAHVVCESRKTEARQPAWARQQR